MTGDELDRLETALELELPDAYRALMQAYPFPPDSFTAECSLPNELSRLLEMNDQRGNRAWPATMGGRRVSTALFLMIGGDGGEQSYLLDLGKAESPVYSWSLETRELRQEAPSLERFVAQCWAADEEIDRGEAETVPRRWWKFWK